MELPTISQKERDALCDLQSSVQKAWRSKPMLRTLSKLHEKNLIEWDALAWTAKLTSYGEAILHQ